MLNFESPLSFEKIIRGDYAIYNQSPLFRAGVFPERIDSRTGKVLEITEEDVQDMVKNFTTPVSGNLFHEEPIFKDAILINKIWNNGKDLFGEVAVPIWMDEQLTDNARKISVEIDPETLKTLTGFALCTNPRITGARLMAARDEYFAKKTHDTYAGQEIMQRVHDTVAMAAVCNPPDKESMAAKHEIKAAQAIHDLSVEHGASCSMANYYSNTGTCPFRKQEKSMKFQEVLGKLFPMFTGRDDVPVDEVQRAIDPSGVVFATEPASYDPTKSTEFIEKDKELVALKELVAKNEADAKASASIKFDAENAAKVDEFIVSKKFDPADRDTLIERRKVNSEVFDAMADLIHPKQEYLFNGIAFETEADLKAEIQRRGLTTGGDLVAKTQGDASLKEQFEATKKALRNLPGGSTL